MLYHQLFYSPITDRVRRGTVSALVERDDVAEFFPNETTQLQIVGLVIC